MRPRFGPAIASRLANATAGPSRWTHRVGVSWQHAAPVTPTWNAIGLSLPVEFDARDAPGSLSPWHSFLPRHAGGVPSARRGGGDTVSQRGEIGAKSLPCRRKHLIEGAFTLRA